MVAIMIMYRNSKQWPSNHVFSMLQATDLSLLKTEVLTMIMALNKHVFIWVEILKNLMAHQVES